MPKLKQIEPTGYNGFPKPKKVNCWQCGQEFWVKFVISRLDYSRKNNWGYWTEKEKYKKQEWCNSCLRKIYQDKLTYLKAVQNSKRRNLFRTYLHEGSI